MHLYKYISFSGYWKDPAQRSALYFSSIPQLRGPNDREEFRHYWRSGSAFFKKYSQKTKEHYEELFKNTFVLCLSKSLNEYCWREFAKMNGVVYQFSFDRRMVATDLTYKDITYAQKEHNVPSFLIHNVSDIKLKELLTKQITIIEPQVADIRNHPETGKLLETHILNELAAKKRPCYSREDELRFIHVSNDTPGTNVKSILINQRLSFKELGIELKGIYSNNLDKVLATLGPQNVPIHIIPEHFDI